MKEVLKQPLSKRNLRRSGCSFIISWGKYGGWYWHNKFTKRLCLGWLAGQAKAMEKEQLINFGYTQIQYIEAEIGDCIYKKLPEEIYNENYDPPS